MPPDPHRPFCLGVFLSLATELVCVCVCVCACVCACACACACTCVYVWLMTHPYKIIFMKKKDLIYTIIIHIYSMFSLLSIKKRQLHFFHPNMNSDLSHCNYLKSLCLRLCNSKLSSTA